MSTILLNTILILIIIVPMVYFVYGGNINKKSINAFRKKAGEINVNPDKIGLWQSGAIGIDKNKRKLVYTSTLIDDNVHEINLENITHCEVKKYYETENVHNQDINMLKSVSLHFKTKQKSEIIIPVYDAKIQTQPGNDLLEAIEWANIISNFISAN